MDFEIFKSYLPVIIGISFFGYRYFKSSKIKKLIPALKERGAQIVDVRSSNEFNVGNNPASINIPVGEIASKASQLDPTFPIILCCATGTRSAMAASALKSKGFEVYNAGNWQNTI